MKLNSSKFLIIIGVFALIPAILSAVIAINADPFTDTGISKSFFRMCSVQNPQVCSSFTWAELGYFGLGSFLIALVLLVLGIKNLRSHSGA
jgi:hypothetical protein